MTKDTEYAAWLKHHWLPNRPPHGERDPSGFRWIYVENCAKWRDGRCCCLTLGGMHVAAGETCSCRGEFEEGK